jgi:glucose-6-phosphate 1-dehydrogenase
VHTYESTPDAYETLFHSLLNKSSSRFATEDEVVEGWRIFEDVLSTEGSFKMSSYACGSEGIVAADRALAEKYDLLPKQLVK